MDDRISELPAPILHHILSFLDEKKAVRTCVMSKSWRHLVSTRPNLILDDVNFGDEEKFMRVLDKSLQVYYDRKLCIEELRVSCGSSCVIDPEKLVSLLKKWIPIVAVKKLLLNFDFENSVLPSVVFEFESLQELYVQCLSLRQIPVNSVVGNKNNLKTLHLQVARIEDETFAEFLSSCCSSIEDLSIHYCGGLLTINMPNHRNLKIFEVERADDNSSNIEIYLPSSVRRITIDRCPNWYHHRNYFPGLTCLRLIEVPLSEEWFNSFSRNFPCLEELLLVDCNGFDELKLSSPSIKKVHIKMDESTTKATIDVPSIKEFYYDAKLSQSISFTATTSSDEWISDIHLSLYQLHASQWFPKISELVAEFSQSHINSLVLYHHSGIGNTHIEHPSNISICCGASSYKPVAIKRLSLDLRGVYYDFFFSDLVIGLFRFFRPREIKQYRKDAFLCRTLQMGRWEEEEEGMRSCFSWQQDLEEVSLQVRNEQWHLVEGTINWSEYVKGRFYKFRFLLKWREF